MLGHGFDLLATAVDDAFVDSRLKYLEKVTSVGALAARTAKRIGKDRAARARQGRCEHGAHKAHESGRGLGRGAAAAFQSAVCAPYCRSMGWPLMTCYERSRVPLCLRWRRSSTAISPWLGSEFVGRLHRVMLAAGWFGL